MTPTRCNCCAKRVESKGFYGNKFCSTLCQGKYRLATKEKAEIIPIVECDCGFWDYMKTTHAKSCSLRMHLENTGFKTYLSYGVWELNK